MSDALLQEIIDVVQKALRNNATEPNVLIEADDTMETVPAWDSLTFMSVFLAINEAFGVDPDFDDAIHYTSVRMLYTYLKERTS